MRYSSCKNSKQNSMILIRTEKDVIDVIIRWGNAQRAKALEGLVSCFAQAGAVMNTMAGEGNSSWILEISSGPEELKSVRCVKKEKVSLDFVNGELDRSVARGGWEQ